MIDCSHGNSNKDFKKQGNVLENVAQQINNGEKNILGVMLESHIQEGNQKLVNKKSLEYGKSITDACIDIKTTEDLLSKLYSSIKWMVYNFVTEILKNIEVIIGTVKLSIP